MGKNVDVIDGSLYLHVIGSLFLEEVVVIINTSLCCITLCRAIESIMHQSIESPGGGGAGMGRG